MEWEMFFGRFHPLMVHLPIGMFILGYLFEILLLSGFKNIITSRKTVLAAYCIGLFSGLAAALTGWLLSLSNDYSFESLNDHRNLGILSLLLLTLLIVYQLTASRNKKLLKFTFSTLTLIIISFTGHLGGNLTHGSDYLSKYGPNFLKTKNQSIQESIKALNQDSINIYTDMLVPLFDNKCVACHNAANDSGGLNLLKYSNLFKDANHEKPIVPGSPSMSELYKRVSLPLSHDKVMPPRQPSLSYTDIQLLKYWIESGADSTSHFKYETMTTELLDLVKRDYGLDFSPKPYYEKIKVDSLTKDVLNELQKNNFLVNYLGETNYLLDISFSGDSIGINNIISLKKIANQITFLKISDCLLRDDLLDSFPTFPHLSKLDLSKNNINEKLKHYVSRHPNLESINLNETKLTHEVLKQILEVSNAKRIYVWNTLVSPEEAKALNQNGVEVVSAFKFEPVKEYKSVLSQ